MIVEKTLSCYGLVFSSRSVEPEPSMASGETVVLIHGFPDNYFTWDQQLPALAAAGYRAVSVATRGYQPESQPKDNNYQLTELAADVVGWLDELGIQKAHLVGHDWGATIAYGAAALAPDRFLSLTTVAVPQPSRLAVAMSKSLSQLWKSRYIFFFQNPGKAEARLPRHGFHYLRKLWKRWSPNWNFSNEQFQSIIETYQQPEVLLAALNYYRQGADVTSDAGLASRALSAAPVQVPTMAISGKKDGCISSDLFVSCMQEEDFPVELCVKQLDGVGHFLHLENPEIFNQLLINWLIAHGDT